MKITYKNLLFLSLMATLIACETVKSKSKDTVNKGGELAGKTASEFFEGVSEGIDRTIECEITLSEELKDRGLQTGAFKVKNREDGGRNNQLILYLISNQDFNQTLSAKAFNKSDLEIGRSSISLNQKAGEASYVSFNFNLNTELEAKSKITLE